jgi:hypothetical protein
LWDLGRPPVYSESASEDACPDLFTQHRRRCILRCWAEEGKPGERGICPCPESKCIYRATSGWPLRTAFTTFTISSLVCLA